jgi:GntR family transcriptional repressor for pyruvate dehydrogenase complex
MSYRIALHHISRWSSVDGRKRNVTKLSDGLPSRHPIWHFCAVMDAKNTQHALQVRDDDPAPAKQNLSQRVYDVMLDRIVREEFPAGGRLPTETALARSFGVSRPVVREALARLRDDGIVTSRKGSGTFLQSRVGKARAEILPIGSINQVLRCHEFRAELEPAAAAAAARNPDRTAVEVIHEALTRVQSETGVPTADASADFAFHLAVARASGNPYFEYMLSSIRDHLVFVMTLGRQLAIRDPQVRIERRLDEHHKIYSAIAEGDTDGAAALMRQHISESRRRLFDGGV